MTSRTLQEFKAPHQVTEPPRRLGMPASATTLHPRSTRAWGHSALSRGPDASGSGSGHATRRGLRHRNRTAGVRRLHRYAPILSRHGPPDIPALSPAKEALIYARG